MFETYRKPLFKYVRTKIADPQQAEDVVQEIFLKAFRFRRSYRKEYALSTWLWTIARNTVTDTLRARRQDRPHDDGLEVEELACPARDAEARLLEKHEVRRLLRILKPLSRLQKRVIWMRAIHQLSNDEIARKLGLSLAAVKNLAYRARIACEGLKGPEALSYS